MELYSFLALRQTTQMCSNLRRCMLIFVDAMGLMKVNKVSLENRLGWSRVRHLLSVSLRLASSNYFSYTHVSLKTCTSENHKKLESSPSTGSRDTEKGHRIGEWMHDAVLATHSYNYFARIVLPWPCFWLDSWHRWLCWNKNVWQAKESVKRCFYRNLW
jgi:hypothetical protein